MNLANPSSLVVAATVIFCALRTPPVQAQCPPVHDAGVQSLFTFIAPFTPQPLLDRPITSADCLNVLLSMAAGGAVGDFDNDGDQDIFFLSGGIEPDRLYINNGSGVFTDQAPAWSVGGSRGPCGNTPAVGCVPDIEDHRNWIERERHR